MLYGIQWFVSFLLLINTPGIGQELKNGEFEDWHSIVHYEKP